MTHEFVLSIADPDLPTTGNVVNAQAKRAREVARGMCDAASAVMLLTIESTAWAVTFSAGLTTGTILGFGVTGRALAAVAAITAIAVSVCALLLRARDQSR